jgi:hypothetical protein
MYDTVLHLNIRLLMAYPELMLHLSQSLELLILEKNHRGEDGTAGITASLPAALKTL